MKEDASKVQNIFCIKFKIERHRIYQLGSKAILALIGPGWLSYLAGELCSFHSKISSYQISYQHAVAILSSSNAKQD